MCAKLFVLLLRFCAGKAGGPPSCAADAIASLRDDLARSERAQMRGHVTHHHALSNASRGYSRAALGRQDAKVVVAQQAGIDDDLRGACGRRTHPEAVMIVLHDAVTNGDDGLTVRKHAIV